MNVAFADMMPGFLRKPTKSILLKVLVMDSLAKSTVPVHSLHQDHTCILSQTDIVLKISLGLEKDPDDLSGRLRNKDSEQSSDINNSSKRIIVFQCPDTER